MVYMGVMAAASCLNNYRKNYFMKFTELAPTLRIATMSNKYPKLKLAEGAARLDLAGSILRMDAAFEVGDEDSQLKAQMETAGYIQAYTEALANLVRGDGQE